MDLTNEDTEADQLLAKIASSDQAESDWDTLRNLIKVKIEKNILLFLTTTQKPPLPAPYNPINTFNGGRKMPPFILRKSNSLNVDDVPLSYMIEQEADAMKVTIFNQLEQFEGPPFTIQRVCELCLEPKRQYKSVGKYLRAVEKSLLVTSTWNSFPPLTPGEIQSAGRSATLLGSALRSAPSTPLFSPIPFLHDDARRSKSRSPPPTPLTLNPSIMAEEPAEIRALGLVDELDHPSPGHMSDQPTPLSSVTTISDTHRTFLDSLDQRFVKVDEMDTTQNHIELDENKENSNTDVSSSSNAAP